MPKRSKAHISNLIDALGSAKAKAAPFLEDERDLNERVAKLGHGDYEGRRYRATVREGERQIVPQLSYIRQLNKLMGPIKALRWIRRNSIERPTTTVKVVAKLAGDK